MRLLASVQAQARLYCSCATVIVEAPHERIVIGQCAEPCGNAEVGSGVQAL